jgi:hypothetical protein
MPPRGPKGYAFNRTRTTYLATNLLIARTHWTRFRGLMATDSSRFPATDSGSAPPTASTPSPCAFPSTPCTSIVTGSSST